MNSWFSIKFGWQETVLGQSSSAGEERLPCLPKGILLFPEGNTTNPTRVACDKRTALGNLLQEEEAAHQLCTHLADLPAGEAVKPFQTHRENLGCTMDCEPLGGSNIFLTP